jgi:HEAT repeat protein
METIWIIILALQAIICGLLAMNVAEHKGHSSGAWFGAGFFFGIFGLIAAAGLPINQSTISVNVLLKKCSDCAESIRKEALVCKYCGKKFSKEEIVADLLGVLQGESASNNLQALDALRSTNDSSVIPSLIIFIDKIRIVDMMDPNNGVLSKAIKLLSDLGSPAISSDLVSIIKKSSVISKSNKLIELLGSYRDPASLPVLIRCLLKQELRFSATDAIINYGQSALPYLERMAKNGKRAEKRIADEIMTRINSESIK